MIPRSRKCKRRRERISEWRKSCAHRRSNMRRPTTTCYAACKISGTRSPKMSWTWARSWTLNWNITSGAVRRSFNSRTIGLACKIGAHNLLQHILISFTGPVQGRLRHAAHEPVPIPAVRSSSDTILFRKRSRMLPRVGPRFARTRPCRCILQTPLHARLSRSAMGTPARFSTAHPPSKGPLSCARNSPNYRGCSGLPVT